MFKNVLSLNYGLLVKMQLTEMTAVRQAKENTQGSFYPRAE